MTLRQKLAACLGSGFTLLVPIVLFLGRGHLVTISPFEPGEAVRQVTALQAKLGHPVQAVSVALTSEEVTVELQSDASPQVTDQWKTSHMRMLRGLIDWVYVSGPEPVQSSRMDVSVKDRAFALEQVDFAAVPQIVRAAIGRVALQEAATVTGMEISKARILIPFEQAGPLGWSVSVKSAHESAEAYADREGRLTGVDLDGTLRAQTLDLYEGGAPLHEIVRAISDQFGGKERIDHLLVYSKEIRFHLAAAGPDARPGTYDSGINGIYRDRMEDSMPAMPALGMGILPENQPFATAEVDWDALPRLVQQGREKLGLNDAKVSLLEIRKRARGLGAPAIEWDIDLQPPAGPSASIVLDGAGTLLDIRRPGAQDEPADMLSPDRIRQFLEAMRHEADPHAAVMEIVLQPDGDIATLRDPRKPDRLVSLKYNGLTFDLRPDPTAMPGKYMGMDYDDDWLFDFATIDAKLLETLPARQQTAIDQLKIPGGKVTAVALGREKEMFEENRQLLVEIVVTGDDRRNGRIYFDPRGRILRMDGP